MSQVITIQQTSKTIKANYLIALLLIVIGMFAGMPLLAVIGFLWYIGTRIVRWWKHA